MGRGKPSLASTVKPDEIVYSGEELGNPPNFLLKNIDGEETLGIVVSQYGYNLAELKDCHRKEKNESGETVVVHYKKWEEFAYCGDFEAAYAYYAKLLIKKKDAQLKKARDIKDVLKNRLEIQKMISEQLSEKIVVQSVQEASKAVKQLETLKKQIESLQNDFEYINSLVEDAKRLMKNVKKATKYTHMEGEDS